MKRGNTGVLMYVRYKSLCEARKCMVPLLLLLYRCLLCCAGAFEIQRKCGLESPSSLCPGWHAHIRPHTHTQKHCCTMAATSKLTV